MKMSEMGTSGLIDKVLLASGRKRALLQATAMKIVCKRYGAVAMARFVEAVHATSDLRKKLAKVAIALSVVAVTGCAQGQVTECGIFVQTSDPGVFAEVQTLEREFVAIADLVVSPNDSRFADTCKALDGWSVAFVDQLEITRDNGDVEDLKGQTWVGSRSMVVETKATVRVSGLVHELAHAVQRGEPKCSAGYDSMHGCWDQNGLTYVIDTIRGEI